MDPSILSLPTEIRILIYDYFLTHLIPTTTTTTTSPSPHLLSSPPPLLRLSPRPTHSRDPTSRCWRRSPSLIHPCAPILALLLTCKRFYRELLPLFYGHKGTRFCFDFDGRAGLRVFLRGKRRGRGNFNFLGSDDSGNGNNNGTQERLGLLKNVEFQINVYRRGRGWRDWMALVKECLGKMAEAENLVFVFRGVRGEGEGEVEGEEKGWEKEVTAIGKVVGGLTAIEGGKLKITLGGRYNEEGLEDAFLQGINVGVIVSPTWVGRVVGRTGFGVS